MCCSQEAHTLCMKSESGTQSGKSACNTSSRDRCDDRAGLGGEQTAWGGTAHSGGLCSSSCAASLREGLGEWGTPAPCDAARCPQSHVPSRLPLLRRVLAPGRLQLQLVRARPPGLLPRSSRTGHSACLPPLPVLTASCHRLFLPRLPTPQRPLSTALPLGWRLSFPAGTLSPLGHCSRCLTQCLAPECWLNDRPV